MFTAPIHSINEIPSVAKQLLEHFPKERVFLLNGEMGSGKTTFIKDLCKVLGVRDGMSSPTYSIVNEYKGTNDLIYHFDLYRLKDVNECLDLGFEEYVHSGHYCFIEWPAIARPLMPDTFVEVDLRVENAVRYLEAKQNHHGV
jgi:tRNA threonylcarbamoyladenosine biosynthesis protein TsaE